MNVASSTAWSPLTESPLSSDWGGFGLRLPQQVGLRDERVVNSLQMARRHVDDTRASDAALITYNFSS